MVEVRCRRARRSTRSLSLVTIHDQVGGPPAERLTAGVACPPSPTVVPLARRRGRGCWPCPRRRRRRADPRPEGTNLLIGRPSNLRRWAAVAPRRAARRRARKARRARPPTSRPIATAIAYVADDVGLPAAARLRAADGALRAARRAPRPEAARLPAPRSRRALPARSPSRPRPAGARTSSGPSATAAPRSARCDALHKLFPLRPCDFVFEPDAGPAARPRLRLRAGRAPAPRRASCACARTTTAALAARGGRARSSAGARVPRSAPGCRRGSAAARARGPGRRSGAGRHRALSRSWPARVLEERAAPRPREGLDDGAGRARLAGAPEPRDDWPWLLPGCTRRGARDGTSRPRTCRRTDCGAAVER